MEELKNYCQILDDIFSNGNLWKHRSFRTVLDCGSHEWTLTTLEQKFDYIKRIEDDCEADYSFQSIAEEYRIHYLEEKKQHVINNLKETLDILYYYALDLDSFLARVIFDAKECCIPKSHFHPIVTRSPIADLYLNDVENYPFYMLLAVTMEAKSKANIIVHSIPYEVAMQCVQYPKMGEPTTIAHLATISQESLKDFFMEKQIHSKEYALRFYHTVQYIQNELDGDVSQLWIHATTKNEIITNLLALPYMYIDKAEKIFTWLNYCYKTTDINESKSNTTTQQFLLQSYFGNIQDKTHAAIKRAYRDLNRTLSGIATLENKEELKEKWEKIIDSFVLDVKIKPINSFDDFDAIHKQYCYKLMEIEEQYMSIGQAQKWLNMTLKYLIILENELVIRNKKYFHIPIDNLIQDKIEIEFGIKKAFPVWSKIEDYIAYLQYQNAIRAILKNTYPIDMEMALFNEIIGVENSKLLQNWEKKVSDWLEED